MTSYLVPCLKELTQYISPFESEDGVFEKNDKALKSSQICRSCAGLKRGLRLVHLSKSRRGYLMNVSKKSSFRTLGFDSLGSKTMLRRTMNYRTQFLVLVSIILASIFVTSCSNEPPNPASDKAVPALSNQPTPAISNRSAPASRLSKCDNSCQKDSECVLIQNSCFGTLAASSDALTCFKDVFEEFQKSDLSKVMKCAPPPPLVKFRAVCRNDVCVRDDK